MKNDPIDSLRRPTKDDDSPLLFDLAPDWTREWWGMPEFKMGDASPQYKVTINFLTLEDLREFSNKTGLSIGAKSDSAWFPPQRLDEPKEWAYVSS